MMKRIQETRARQLATIKAAAQLSKVSVVGGSEVTETKAGKGKPVVNAVKQPPRGVLGRVSP